MRFRCCYVSNCTASRLARCVLAVGLALILCILLGLFGVSKPQPTNQPDQAPPKIFPFSSTLAVQNEEDFSASSDDKTQQEIHIAAAICGNRSTMGLTMMKSALIMCSDFIKFTLFVDSESSGILWEAIQRWPDSVLKRMSLDMRPVRYPENGAEKWKTLFRPCSSARLFFPNWLKEVDSVLYVDADAVFLSSPMRIWRLLSKMNDVQMAALGPETQDYATGWYQKFAKHPYYGKFGVNAGVMLMNLTKMRRFGLEQYSIRVHEQYKTRIQYGDQDIINIIFHFHPEKLYVYPCNYNYISHQCAGDSLCKETEQQGIVILHGNADAFLSDRLPAVKAMYTSIQQHSFGDSLRTLLANMKENLMKTPISSCRKVMDTLPMFSMDR